MQELPKDFVQLMSEHYGLVEAECLCKALAETEPEVSIRLNARKIAASDTLNGFSNRLLLLVQLP